MQWNCHERERKFEDSNRHMRSKPQVNYAESRSQDHDSDCDKVGLVVQHVLSAGVEMSPRGTGSWTQELLVMYAMIVIHLLNCII